ncbi:hypothetical protein R3P38DRAFT_2395383, partial [Favolaschia claudopus]
LRTCAGLIFTAMNNHPVDIRGFSADYIPVTLPRLALEQTGLIFPSIGLFLGRKHRRHVEPRTFDSFDDALEFINHFQRAFRFGLACLGKIKATALRLREASLCNPGAGVNMSLEEWLGR